MNYARRAHNSLCTLLEIDYDSVEVVSTEDKAWQYIGGVEVDITDTFQYFLGKSKQCLVDSNGNWLKDIYK